MVSVKDRTNVGRNATIAQAAQLGKMQESSRCSILCSKKADTDRPLSSPLLSSLCIPVHTRATHSLQFDKKLCIMILKGDHQVDSDTACLREDGSVQQNLHTGKCCLGSELEAPIHHRHCHRKDCHRDSANVSQRTQRILTQNRKLSPSSAIRQ